MINLTTIQELTQLELPALLDMLSNKTLEYLRLLRENKHSIEAVKIKKEIQKIQQVIEHKRTNA